MPNSRYEKLIFILIILLASVLRFWNFWGWSYSHDELGAFVRLNYNSFSELYSHGVGNDTHPAFTQVFLFFWTKCFGYSEFAVRLPFVIAGILSVPLIYLIAKKWFGITTACFSSLCFAIIAYPILYSQLARPYSFGLFFSLLAVWCWINLLIGDNKKMFLKSICYGVATALCMLTHYFSFFFAIIVAATGIFFLKKETWKPYLLSGLVALVLFSPHIPMSLKQFSMGGVGEWLAKPEGDYLWKYILYAFNESSFLVVLIALVSLTGVLLYHNYLSINKFQAVSVIWFALPFLAGYYYSVNVNPVLQYSTLLFSFPFLLICLFSFFRENYPKTNQVLLFSFGIVLLYSTVFEQRFFKKEFFGVFKEINEKTADWSEKFGNENITTALNSSGKEVMDFYFNRMNKKIPFYYYAGDDPSFTANMLERIDSASTPYFAYGWSNFRSPYEIPEMIKRKYSCVVEDEKHFNSQITLFKKSDSCKRDTIFFATADFEKYNPVFWYDESKTDTLNFQTGKRSLNIDPDYSYCVILKTTVKKLCGWVLYDLGKMACVNASVQLFSEGDFNAQIVMEVGSGGGKKEWQTKLLESFVRKKGSWQEAFATFEFPASVYPDDEVTIYLWNPEKNSFRADDFTISTFADSQYNYYETSYRK